MVRGYINPPVRPHLVCFIQNSGIVVTLFFQCIGTLIGPENRTKNGIKWGLVAHTVAMFSIVTVYTAAALSILSISYIDNREFPCVDGALPLGPIGYQYLTYSNPTNVVVTVMFLLNNWLADGLLVTCVPNSLIHVSDVGRRSSSIVVTSFILGISGPLPSRF